MKQSSVKKQLALWIMGACLSIGTIPAYSATAAPTLTYSWPTNAGPLDPRGYSPNQMYAQAMVYEPLVRYTAEGTLEPWLATHWSVSPDGKTYTFTLRDHVQFSDGSPFNAAAA
ncbi:ABC transporter substrate-binding protein, partial [Pseudomonas helleri]|uniref:ABC transporter substrate-binding protein n=2 Tax=Pseudomonas TaxID=286 RepID=UPI003F9B1EE7